MAVVAVEQLLGVDCDEEAEKHYRWVQGDCVCGRVEVWCEGEEAEKHYRWVQGDCVFGRREVWCGDEEAGRLTTPGAR